MKNDERRRKRMTYSHTFNNIIYVVTNGKRESVKERERMLKSDSCSFEWMARRKKSIERRKRTPQATKMHINQMKIKRNICI